MTQRKLPSYQYDRNLFAYNQHGDKMISLHSVLNTMNRDKLGRMVDQESILALLDKMGADLKLPEAARDKLPEDPLSRLTYIVEQQAKKRWEARSEEDTSLKAFEDVFFMKESARGTSYFARQDIIMDLLLENQIVPYDGCRTTGFSLLTEEEKEIVNELWAKNEELPPDLREKVDRVSWTASLGHRAGFFDLMPEEKPESCKGR